MVLAQLSDRLQSALRGVQSNNDLDEKAVDQALGTIATALLQVGKLRTFSPEINRAMSTSS